MRIALAGDTMLGRGVAEQLLATGPERLFSDELIAVAGEGDLRIVNLECCISERGAPAPDRVFHFRAPPVAVEALARLGVECVTLANNHALDFGPDALIDTLDHLRRAGIAAVGAGGDEEVARAPVTLAAGDERLRVIAVGDHPSEYAAGAGRPGIAFADLERNPAPDWLTEAIGAPDLEPVLVAPHWGPNMVAAPLAHVRRAAVELLRAGATLIAGHSAHVFHGVGGRVLFDLGDFVDDYRVDRVLRNDLGLLWLVDIDRGQPRRLEAVPLKLDFCRTELAGGDDARWILRRFASACEALGTSVREVGGRAVVELTA